jgi:hypothetical protein
MKKANTYQEKELLETLINVINQACSYEDALDSQALTAYASAMVLLEEYGMVKIDCRAGRRVIGKFTNKNLAS